MTLSNTTSFFFFSFFSFFWGGGGGGGVEEICGKGHIFLLTILFSKTGFPYCHRWIVCGLLTVTNRSTESDIAFPRRWKRSLINDWFTLSPIFRELIRMIYLHARKIDCAQLNADLTLDFVTTDNFVSTKRHFVQMVSNGMQQCGKWKPK